MNARVLAAQMIVSVKQGRSLSECLAANLSKAKNQQEAAFVQALSYGVCRFYPRLEIILNHFLKKPLREKDALIHALLLIGLYQLTSMRLPHYAVINETAQASAVLKAPWGVKLINAVLRQYLRQGKILEEGMHQHPVAYYAHPAWWIEKIKKAWPHDFHRILLANNEHPPFALRINRRKISRAIYLQKLKHFERVELIKGTHDGVIVYPPSLVEHLPGFGEGEVCVQDGGAQLAAGLMDLAPRQRVLDACAAPGGKLLQMLEYQPDLQITAVDKDAHRLSRVEENLSRLGAAATLICNDVTKLSAWWDGQLFDRILLDGPCSASGVIRRHPDIKLLRKRSDIDALAHQLRHLLEAVWPLLKSGGLLLYATCSIFPEENAQVIRNFLNAHRDAKALEIEANWGVPCDIGRQILPGMHQMDGFYYARLSK